MTLRAAMFDHFFFELAFMKILVAGFTPETRKMERLFLLGGLFVAFFTRSGDVRAVQRKLRRVVSPNQKR